MKLWLPRHWWLWLKASSIQQIIRVNQYLNRKTDEPPLPAREPPKKYGKRDR